MVDEVKTTATPSFPRVEGEVFEKRWFCAAMFADGSIFTKDADSPVPLLEVLDRASIVWIDYRTKDAPSLRGFRHRARFQDALHTDTHEGRAGCTTL
jgi:hypothetical protein